MSALCPSSGRARCSLVAGPRIFASPLACSLPACARPLLAPISALSAFFVESLISLSVSDCGLFPFLCDFPARWRWSPSLRPRAPSSRLFPLLLLGELPPDSSRLFSSCAWLRPLYPSRFFAGGFHWVHPFLSCPVVPGSFRASSLCSSCCLPPLWPALLAPACCSLLSLCFVFCAFPSLGLFVVQLSSISDSDLRAAWLAFPFLLSFRCPCPRPGFTLCAVPRLFLPLPLRFSVFCSSPVFFRGLGLFFSRRYFDHSYRP